MRTSHRLHILLALLLIAGCPSGPSDDDDTGVDDDDSAVDDDDSAADDDDSAYIEITVSGSVLSVDQETGVALTDEEFEDRGSSMVVFLTDDPADLSNPLAKFDFATATGSWSTTLLGDGSSLYAVVIVDRNRNRIIEQHDILREYGGNPFQVNDLDLPDIDIVVDLAPRGPGGGGGCCDGQPCTIVEGTTVLLRGGTGEVAITANAPDLSVGPYEQRYLASAGAFDICVNDNRFYTSLLGIHDSDANGLFEPSDDIGEAQINPIALGIGDVIGAVIEIPAAVPVSLPTPPAYVELEGDVLFPGYTAGDVLVVTTVGASTYSSTTTPAPGPFALRAPPNTEDLVVTAVIDVNSNGVADATEPMGQVTISTSIYDVQGLVITTLDPLDNSISGEVSWGGPVDGADSLLLALLDDPDGGGAPLAVVTIPAPVFPQAYTVPNLLSGTYYVTGYLDYGSDGGGAGPGEPIGLYGSPGSPPTPVVLSSGSHPNDIDFGLVPQGPTGP